MTFPSFLFGSDTHFIIKSFSIRNRTARFDHLSFLYAGTYSPDFHSKLRATKVVAIDASSEIVRIHLVNSVNNISMI